MLDYLQLYPETIKQLKRYNKEQRCNLYEAMAEYAFTGQEPDWPDDAPEWFIWETLKQHVNRPYRDSIQEIRNRPEYRRWRQDVFKRDNYTCQFCGKKGGNINAHHIKRFSDYPELRMKLSNGITLCYNCHQAVHKGHIVLEKE